jgi:hypothetical protein
MAGLGNLDSLRRSFGWQSERNCQTDLQGGVEAGVRIGHSSVFVDDEQHRDAFDFEGIGCPVVEIEKHGEGEFGFACERFRGSAIVVDTDGQELERLCFSVIALVEIAQNRQLETARPAPTCPESDDDLFLAVEIAQGYKAPVERGQGEIRRLLVEHFGGSIPVLDVLLQGFGPPGDEYSESRERDDADEGRYGRLWVHSTRKRVVFRAEPVLLSLQRVFLTDALRAEGF